MFIKKKFVVSEFCMKTRMLNDLVEHFLKDDSKSDHSSQANLIHVGKK